MGWVVYVVGKIGQERREAKVESRGPGGVRDGGTVDYTRRRVSSVQVSSFKEDRKKFQVEAVRFQENRGLRRWDGQNILTTDGHR